MTVQRIRFRVQDALVILQVQEPPKVNQYSYGERDGEWRDAKAEDLLEVAAYTRAYDALDKTIESLRNSVVTANDRMSEIMDREMRFLGEAK